jgi:hypothetical protein
MSTTLAPTKTKTDYFSCLPWTRLELDGHAAAMDKILTALEADPRAIGPVVGFDDGTLRVDALFQVSTGDADVRIEPATAADAAKLAIEIFDAALVAAGLEQRTTGLTIVEGDDPDLLP